MMRFLLSALAALFVTSSPAAAQSPPEWSQPVAPFHIAGPVWYVGTKGLAVYAVKTRDGAILLSGPLEQDAMQVERNLETIGVPIRQVRYILNSHAHFDHAAAFAKLRGDSGARLVSSAADAPALRRGRHAADNENGHTLFPAVPIDRIVRDGEAVRLGDVAITAILTPGHTPGCTTWTMPVRDGATVLRIVFPCSLTVAGNRLFDNRAYPGIVADYRRSFDRLDRMPADIVLPMHPGYADVLGRGARRDASDAGAFRDPGQLRRLVAEARADFAKDYAAQTSKR